MTPRSTLGESVMRNCRVLLLPILLLNIALASAQEPAGPGIGTR